ncbi:MAG: hypothetical protein J7K95_02045, partial [Thermoplasmata archaeon]|nr:hypothetical protein [Thermoplasmata archaeon]
IRFKIYTQATLIYSLNESKLNVNIIKPCEGMLYIFDREIMSTASSEAIVIGRITIEAQTNGNKVEFYIDDEIKFTDDDPPYSWQWNEFSFGEYEIKVIAYKNERTAEDSVHVFKIF